MQIHLFSAEPRMGEVEAHFGQAEVIPLLIGVDEAGRGPLAGPVGVAAVALPSGELPRELHALDDSKRLTEARREQLFPLVRQHALAYAIELVPPRVVDEINILQATFLGMRTCVSRVLTALGESGVESVAAARGTGVAEGNTDDGTSWSGVRVLVDGKMPIPWPDGEPCPQTAIVEGDARSRNIAAASILAKVARDRVMLELDAQFPVYGFARHKGYPTAQHRAALRDHGPCSEHRRSFKTVAATLQEASS